MSLDYQATVRRIRQATWIAIVVTAGAAIAIVAYGVRAFHRSGGFAAGGALGNTFVTVLPGTLEIRIKKDGELQAVTNTDIVCQVEGQSIIRTIVPEGTFVKKGDPLFELDSSDLRRRLQTAMIDVQRGESELTAAQEQLAIQHSKNTADLEAANVELKLARLELQEYTDGKYPQALSDAKRNVEMARSDFKSKEQAMAQTKALMVKGFVTQTELERAQLELVKAQNEFEKKSTELEVLEKYTHEKELADKMNKVAQAAKKVARVNAENASTLAQKQADAKTKERSLLVYRGTLQHMEDQMLACTVAAPTDGIVVYGSSVPVYFRESPIQTGARVTEQQLVVRLPETGAMKAVVKIPERQAVTLRVDADNPLRALVRIVGREAPIGATVTGMSVLSDSMQRWWNPDLKEYPIDLTLDQTPPGLTPGTSVSVELLIDRLMDVLSVPAAAIYSEGEKSYVFLPAGSGLRPVEVKLGVSNETHVQITEGLKSGERVVMLQAGQGRDLLKRAGIEPPPPPAADLPAAEPDAVPAAAPAAAPTSQPAQMQAGTVAQLAPAAESR